MNYLLLITVVAALLIGLLAFPITMSTSMSAGPQVFIDSATVIVGGGPVDHLT